MLSLINSNVLKCIHDPVILAKHSLHEFTKQSWHVKEGATNFTDGFHIQAIVEHLEAVAKRDIKKLLINIPYRCSKSTLVSIDFPAWLWLTQPHTAFLFATHTESLAIEHSVKCRRLITSDWYQERYSNCFELMHDQNAKKRFDNNKGGYRLCTSVKGGGTTGKGGNIIIIDDPNNIQDRLSDRIREATIEWFSQVMTSRKNDPKNDCMIVIQQRSHPRDVSGFIIENDIANSWEKLILPMEFIPSKKCVTTLSKIKNIKWEDPRTEQDQLLWEERFSFEVVEQFKKDLGSPFAVASQLQQNPLVEEGNLIKKDWFKLWKSNNYPQFEYILQSWDTATTGSISSAYSACTTWGIFYDEDYIAQIMLLGLWRGKVGFPELKKMAQRLYRDYRDNGATHNPIFKGRPIDCCIIEAKSTGDALIQELRTVGINALPFTVNRGSTFDPNNKTRRVELITGIIEEGRVWLPTIPPNFNVLTEFADIFRNACISFPHHDSNDIVDTMSQALTKLKERNIMSAVSKTTQNKMYIGQVV